MSTCTLPSIHLKVRHLRFCFNGKPSDKTYQCQNFVTCLANTKQSARKHGLTRLCLGNRRTLVICFTAPDQDTGDYPRVESGFAGWGRERFPVHGTRVAENVTQLQPDAVPPAPPLPGADTERFIRMKCESGDGVYVYSFRHPCDAAALASKRLMNVR